MSTLPKLLIGLSQQLHIMFGTPVLPEKISSSHIEDVGELFQDILRIVSSQTKSCVLLVLDSVDKLATPLSEIAEFLQYLEGLIPSKVSLLVTMKKTVIYTMEEEREIYKKLAEKVVKDSKGIFFFFFL